MKTRLSSDFKRGFLLSEEHLVKLSDIVSKRAVERNISLPLHYKAYRSDGVTYEMDAYAGIITEENSKRYAVTALNIACVREPLELHIEFNHKKGASIAVESQDRDFAFLIFSDIKEYFGAEILSSRSFSFEQVLGNKTATAFSLIVVMLITFIPILRAPAVDADGLAKVIASTDQIDKLNFLLKNDRNLQNYGPTLWLFPAFAVFMLLSLVGGSSLDKLFPRNIFYWGKMIEVHNKRIDLRGKILWGILIAFVIGIVTTFAVDFLKAHAIGS